MMRVEQLRGGVVEAWHEVHVAVVDSTGGLVARTGDPELVTFWRSAAKPFQALPLVEDGAAARVGLTSEELALACASHSSEPDQVARVLGARSPVRPAPTVVRSGGPRLPDARLTAYGGLLELLGETRRYARAGAPPRLAHGVLYAARAPRAAALPRGGESLDGGRGRRHPNRCGWMRSRVLRASAEKHGPGVREVGKRGRRNAERGAAARPSRCERPCRAIPRSHFRVPRCRVHAAPPRPHRR